MQRLGTALGLTNLVIEAWVMLPPPLRFLLRSFRFSASARWLSCCRAAVAIAELFAAAAAGDTLRCCFLVSYPAPRRFCWPLHSSERTGYLV